MVKLHIQKQKRKILARSTYCLTIKLTLISFSCFFHSFYFVAVHRYYENDSEGRRVQKTRSRTVVTATAIEDFAWTDFRIRGPVFKTERIRKENMLMFGLFQFYDDYADSKTNYAIKRAEKQMAARMRQCDTNGSGYAHFGKTEFSFFVVPHKWFAYFSCKTSRQKWSWYNILIHFLVGTGTILYILFMVSLVSQGLSFNYVKEVTTDECYDLRKPKGRTQDLPFVERINKIQQETVTQDSPFAERIKQIQQETADRSKNSSKIGIDELRNNKENATIAVKDDMLKTKHKKFATLQDIFQAIDRSGNGFINDKDIDDFILKGDGMTAWWDNMEEYGYYNGALGPELYDELHRAQILPNMNFTEFVKMVQSTKLIYKKIRLIIEHIIEGHEIPASESEQTVPVVQEFCVGPIPAYLMSKQYLKEKADKWIANNKPNEGWKFTGEWHSSGGTSYCKFKKANE